VLSGLCHCSYAKAGARRRRRDTSAAEGGGASAADALGLAGDDTTDDPTAQYEESSAVTPFVTLTLEIPPPPLFKDELQGNVIPQVPITQLLEKFNGTTVKRFLNGERRRYELQSLPRI
jgi:hypothetical protein